MNSYLQGPAVHRGAPRFPAPPRAARRTAGADRSVAGRRPGPHRRQTDV